LLRVLTLSGGAWSESLVVEVVSIGKVRAEQEYL